MRKLIPESQLAALAKRFREQAGKTKAQAARELGISRSTMQLAEEYPARSLTALRCRIIQTYSRFKVKGPMFWLEEK